MATLVYEAPSKVTLETLETELGRAFVTVRSALERGEPVVVALDERDVSGAGEPVPAALAHALLGLVRALALEGREPGWRINALVSGPVNDADQHRTWTERLGEPAGASGIVVRLGGGHLGKVPV